MDALGSWNPEVGFFHSVTKDVHFSSRKRIRAYTRSTANGARRPRMVKRYPQAPTIALPRPELDTSFAQVLLARRTSRRYSSEPVTLPQLSSVLALSVGVQSVARAERLFTVGAGAFHPRPKVDSAVLRLTPLAQPLVSPEQQWSFRRMVVGLFGFRRKQLARGLRELTGWAPAQVAEALTTVDVPATARPEVVTPERFAALHAVLVDGGWTSR